MKLHFDPNQQYQIDAIVGVFEGQPLNHGEFSFTIDTPLPSGGVGNQLTISNEQILTRLSKKRELALNPP